MNWEYRVVPAPVKGKRARGVKGPEAQFALSVETVINEMAARGWEYCRAEMLPQEERRSRTTYRNLLVFRREARVATGGERPEDIAPELSAELRSGRAARPGLGKRLLDGIMARPAKRQEPRVGKAEAPLFQHEDMRRPAAPAVAAPTAATDTEMPEAPEADPRRDT